MKNVSPKKKWNIGVVQVHMEPPLTPPDKSKHGDRLDRNFVNIKLRRDPMSENSDLYEFKMALFDNGDPGQFLLFVRNFNINPEASGTLKTAAKVKYRSIIICG